MEYHNECYECGHKWDSEDGDEPCPECNEFDNVETEPQHGREPDKVKPLAQYLSKYLDQEHEHGEKYTACFINSYPDGSANLDTYCLQAALEQALNAYESTEQVKIRIERV